MAASFAILLTAPAPAAIAVIRLTGPATIPFLKTHFSRQPKPNTPVYGLLRDNDQTFDDCLVYQHADQPSADVNIHGGPWIIRQVLDLAARNGFQISPSGDIPPETFNARDDLERQILRELPNASTPEAIKILLAQNTAWRRPHHPLTLTRAPRDRSLWWMLHPPKLAIIGAPNVGKSTLANQLFARQRSITSDIPGTTRDWIAEPANLDGLPVLLIDTPGMRQTTDEIEQAGITLSRPQIAAADIVLLVLDPTQPPEPDQHPLVAQYPNALIILNKSDHSQSPPLDLPHPPISTVATTGRGVPDLRRAIQRRFLRPWRHATRPRALTPSQLPMPFCR